MVYRIQRLFCVFVLAVVSAVFFPACTRAPADSSLAAVRSRNVLRVGVKPGMPGFCFVGNNGSYDGLEAALGRLLAEAIVGPEGQVEFVPVDAQTRSILLDSGEIDIVIANFTITEERQRRFHFSAAYYADSVGFMVRKDSGIKKLSDLNGRIVGVARDSTTESLIKDAAPGIGIVNFATFSDIKNALDAKTIAAFSIDNPILQGFLDDTVEIIPATVGIQYYGAVCRLSHLELAKTLDACIDKWLADGTIDRLIAEYNL